MMKRVFVTALLLVAGSVAAFAGSKTPYSVEIYFDKLTVLKAVEGPGDTQEDLFGDIDIKMVRYPLEPVPGTPGKKDTPRFFGSGVANLWRSSDHPSVQLGTGQSRSYATVVAIGDPAGLTKYEVTHLVFRVDGDIKDWEPLGPIHYKRCDECGDTGRVIQLENYISQIESIAPGESKFLTIGSDQTFQLDWYEGDANSSHVRALMKVKISRAN